MLTNKDNFSQFFYAFFVRYLRENSTGCLFRMITLCDFLKIILQPIVGQIVQLLHTITGALKYQI